LLVLTVLLPPLIYAQLMQRSMMSDVLSKNYIVREELVLIFIKGKVIPLQARCGPEGG